VLEKIGNAGYYDVIGEDGRIVLTPLHPEAAAAVHNRLAEPGKREADVVDTGAWPLNPLPPDGGVDRHLQHLGLGREQHAQLELLSCHLICHGMDRPRSTPHR